MSKVNVELFAKEFYSRLNRNQWGDIDPLWVRTVAKEDMSNSTETDNFDTLNAKALRKILYHTLKAYEQKNNL